MHDNEVGNQNDVRFYPLKPDMIPSDRVQSKPGDDREELTYARLLPARQSE